MGKKIFDAQIDEQLDVVTGTYIYLCAGEPVDYADVAARALAGQAIVGAQPKANGDTSGRKVTTPQQVDAPITAGGDADHVVHTDGTSTIKRITTMPAQTLVFTGSSTVTINAHSHEISDNQ